MNIISALKNYEGTRVSYGDKWLIYDNDNWVVYRRKYNAKHSITLIETDIEDIAIQKLCEDDEE